MKDLKSYIHESIDDDNNILWLLDKWFEYNEQDYQDFISIISLFNKQRTIDIKVLGSSIGKFKLNDHIKEFINFIDDDLDPQTDKDYLYSLKKILEYVINNQSKKSKKYKEEI